MSGVTHWRYIDAPEPLPAALVAALVAALERK